MRHDSQNGRAENENHNHQNAYCAAHIRFLAGYFGSPSPRQIIICPFAAW
jgi:hypothetical protein